uniref:Uncharacterized protein n=1 Tax=Romanomermis culicivorax TaxID=13658 RepID=A0A915IGW3_ROMCU
GENETYSRRISTFPDDNNLVQHKSYEFEGTHHQIRQHEDSGKILKLKDEMDNQSSLSHFVVRKKWIMLVRDLGKTL